MDTDYLSKLHTIMIRTAFMRGPFLLKKLQNSWHDNCFIIGQDNLSIHLEVRKGVQDEKIAFSPIPGSGYEDNMWV